MSSSVDTAVPIIVLVTLVTLIGVIYGTLELYDNESSAWDVLKGLLSGDITLWDIWEGKKDRSGVCQGPDTNAVYEYNEKGDCTFLGCKPGYFEQNGICVQSRDRSDDLIAGEETVDCVIDGYTYGQCLDKVTTEPLTGSKGSCGIGIRSKNPNITSSGIGLGSTCEESSEEECSVPCPLECEAPESLWVPVEGAHCVGNSRYLGVPIDEGDGVEVTYHGEGVQQKKLLEISEIPVSLYMGTHDTAQEYADSINYDKCVDSVEKLCKIEPTPTSKWMGCPLDTTEIGWVYHDNGAVFTKDSAEAYMADASKYGELELEPAVRRERAIELGVLNDKGEVLDLEKMPKGYKIKYKAINNQSYAETLENDCTIVQLEEASAPRVAEDCEIEDLYGDCFSVACGTRYSRTVTPTLKKQAWGAGVCNLGNPYTDTRSCTTSDLPCCVKGNDYHYKSGGCIEGTETFTQDTDECSIKNQNGGVSSYTEECCTQSGWSPVTGYEGCELVDGVWKRKYTRTVTSGCTGVDAETVEYRDDGDCKYDCAITSISFEDGTVNDNVSSGGMYCARKSYFRQIATMDTREPKGGGATCDNKYEVGDPIVESDSITRSYDVLPSADMPSFRCGSIKITGGCGGWNEESGYGCQAGDAIPEPGNYGRYWE